MKRIIVEEMSGTSDPNASLFVANDLHPNAAGNVLIGDLFANKIIADL